MPKKNFTQDEYSQTFLSDDKIRRRALDIALDIRKFEIDLYWKRASYFWTFIAAALAAFGVIQASDIENKSDLSVILCCLGYVFSVGWLCVNRGSKHWQENWENHLDLLEDKECGPIYKVVLTRRPPQTVNEKIEHVITGPSPISVSKTNQIISLYVSILWAGLIFYSLPPFNFSASFNWFYVSIMFLSAVTSASFFFKIGATYDGGYWHSATIRTSSIQPATGSQRQSDA